MVDRARLVAHPTHYPLPTTHYPLPTTHHPPPTTHYRWWAEHDWLRILPGKLQLTPLAAASICDTAPVESLVPGGERHTHTADPFDATRFLAKAYAGSGGQSQHTLAVAQLGEPARPRPVFVPLTGVCSAMCIEGYGLKRVMKFIWQREVTEDTPRPPILA